MRISSRMPIRLIAIAAGTLIGFAAANADEKKHVAIVSMVDTPQLVEVRDGIIKGLASHGFIDGKSATIEYKTAQGSFATAQQIARQYVGDAPDVIVAITTPVSQAVVSSTKTIPVVFSTVTDPIGAKIIPASGQPRGNITGVSDVVPTELQLDLIRKILPNFKTLGLLYDSSQDSARSTADSIKKLAPARGFSVIEAPAMGVNNVASAAQSLVGKVDAIFVPNDTIVYSAFETVVKVAQDTKTPLFSAERRSVQRGSIGTVGFDFSQVGEQTAELVSQILNGKKPEDVEVIYMKDIPNAAGLYLNKASAEKIGVTLPDSLLKSATVY
jgi:putative tryptophan/tyrosine transport system substrate-binding protein